jgi:diacylglycerol kinase
LPVFYPYRLFDKIVANLPDDSQKFHPMYNTQTKKFSVSRRLDSFAYAFSGFRYFFITQHNAWIHALATTMTILFGFLFQLSRMEWVAVIIAMAMVWITEMVNTAIEKTMDHLSPATHPAVKLIKDVSAAAVLAAAFAAFIIGLIIFIPKFL